MNHYAGDLRFHEGANLTPADLKELVCDQLRMCASVGCYRCGLGDDEAITCNQMDSAEAGYELQVGSSEGPQTHTGAPGWLVLAWWSRAGLHFEINLDEGAAYGDLAGLWTALRAYGYLDLTFSNRTAGPAEHPAASHPIFRHQER